MAAAAFCSDGSEQRLNANARRVFLRQPSTFAQTSRLTAVACAYTTSSDSIGRSSTASPRPATSAAPLHSRVSLSE
eukprot:COSAG04_NODE_18_length_39571_cov_50.788128_7_plen_76_part_00